MDWSKTWSFRLTKRKVSSPDFQQKKNLFIQVEALKKELGIEVLLVNAKSGDGISELKELIASPHNFKTPKRLWSWDEKREIFFQNLLKKLETDNAHYLQFVLGNTLKKEIRRFQAFGYPEKYNLLDF